MNTNGTHHEFCIKYQQTSADIGKCCLCGDEFRLTYAGIYALSHPNEDGPFPEHNESPVCATCAWQHANELMKMLHLADTAAEFMDYQAPCPKDIADEIERRANDPERIKRELLAASERLGSNGHGPGSPLLKMVHEEIKGAIKTGDIDRMKHARTLFQEANTGSLLDSEIPF